MPEGGPGGMPMADSGTYKYGVTPGTGANLEDLRGARKRRKKDSQPAITMTDGNAVPKRVRPRRRGNASQ